ncbi:MAG: CobW family GTP-binding protein [Parvibaculales bacterium]
MNTSPTPLTIISGFLGAGKTSLLNHLLHHAGGRRITALVNDFGALNIDSELIAAEHGGEISLANGCVCCSISDDLGVALADALNRSPRPDHIVIEASGVADPARIALYAQVDRELRLDGIVTLIDAPAHETHAGDPHIGDTYARQMAAADLFVVTKSDLADETQMQATTQALEKTRSNAPVLQATNGVIETDIILGIGRADDAALPYKQAHAADHGFRQWSGHIAPETDRHKLAEKLRALSPHIIRAKGIFCDAEGTYAIHYAGQRISFAHHAGRASGHLVVIGKPELPAPTYLSAYFEQARDGARA